DETIPYAGNVVTFTLPGTGREFEAVELRRVAGGTRPIVDAATALQVVAAMGRSRAWIGRNLAVKAPGIPGEVIEVLRPDDKGHYDLASITWLGDRPGDAPTSSWTPTRQEPARTRGRARA